MFTEQELARIRIIVKALVTAVKMVECNRCDLAIEGLVGLALTASEWKEMKTLIKKLEV